MTTAETARLSEDFRRRAVACRTQGNRQAANVWDTASGLLADAEGRSLIASFERSQKRRRKTITTAR